MSLTTMARVDGKVELTLDGDHVTHILILTKRPQRMLDWITKQDTRLSNLWLGVTAENQRTADERIPILLQIPAAKHFVSVEPMLGPVDLNATSAGDILCRCDGCLSMTPNTRLDWVIAGPETGPRARPTSIDWVRDLSNQCKSACVPFFDKKDVLGETIQEWPR